MFKQLHINLPLVEALAQIPKYAKFLKDLLTNKRKLGDVAMATLSKECSAILQNKLPRKLKDLSNFIIPCVIGDSIEDNTLAVLDASICVMPCKIFMKLSLGELTPTKMMIHSIDRLVRHPRDVVEDMLVKVDKFIF